MDNSIIEKTLACLRKGGVILYPTDTIWGIGCDASNAEAVEKIYSIKRRDHSKSMLILADRDTFHTDNATIDRLLLDSTRPTTVIMPVSLLPKGINLATNLPARDGTIGVRLPQHDFCLKMIRGLGQPIVSTSANFSGQPSPARYEEIVKELKATVDYCVPNDAETTAGGSCGSKIVKIDESGVIMVIRE